MQSKFYTQDVDRFFDYLKNKIRHFEPESFSSGRYSSDCWLPDKEPSRGVRISFGYGKGGGGCSFKIRPTHKSIDDTLIQPKFVL